MSCAVVPTLTSAHTPHPPNVDSSAAGNRPRVTHQDASARTEEVIIRDDVVFRLVMRFYLMRHSSDHMWNILTASSHRTGVLEPSVMPVVTLLRCRTSTRKKASCCESLLFPPLFTEEGLASHLSGASTELAALIISHFEAVTHFARHLLVVAQTLSFPCRGSLCLSEALIIFCTNRFWKQSAEGLLSTAAFVNIK